VIPREVELSDEQVDDLRALPRLQYLEVHGLSSPVLRRLLAQPHDLQWQRLLPPLPLTDDDTALLPQLPSLTELKIDAEYLTNFDFLQRLPNLTSLDCRTDGTDPLLPERLVAGLRPCANITDLLLQNCHGLTAAHLAEILAHLSRLQSLKLWRLGVDSLSFLAQAPLSSQLSRLVLWSCRQLPVAELRHVHSLRGLRELQIRTSFEEIMDPECDALAVLRPPSAALPLLRSFAFQA
jgi:hypothetical protein